MILIYCSSYKNETTRNDMKKPKIKKKCKLDNKRKNWQIFDLFWEKKRPTKNTMWNLVYGLA